MSWGSLNKPETQVFWGVYVKATVTPGAWQNKGSVVHSSRLGEGELLCPNELEPVSLPALF